MPCNDAKLRQEAPSGTRTLPEQSSEPRKPQSSARHRALAICRPCRCHLCSSSEETLRVDRFALDPCFVMQVRARRAPGRADAPEDAADFYGLPDGDADRGKMAVAARHAVRMLDLDHVAVG